MKTMNSAVTEPVGAYVSLHDLQKLRYSARSLVNRPLKTAIASHSGHHRSRALSRGMEFEEVRLYQAGDDVRNIDWRVTARTQVTHTKRYQDEKEKPVLTLVDQRRSLFFGSQNCFKSVYACHIAALINWATLQRNDKAGGMVIGTRAIAETRPARSHKTVNQWLHQLQQANQQLHADATHKQPALSQSLKQLRSVATSGYECFIVSDFYDLDQECEHFLFDLSRKHKLTFCWIVDPLEKTLPLLSQITLSNGTDKTSLAINRLQQTQHQQSYRNKRHAMQSLCRKLSIGLIELDNGQPLMTSVAPILKT